MGAGGAAGGAVGCHGFRLQRTGHGGKIGGCDLGVLPCNSLDWLRLDPGQQLLDELLHRHHLLRRAQSPSRRGSSRALPCPKHGGMRAAQPPRSESGNKHVPCVLDSAMSLPCLTHRAGVGPKAETSP